MRAAGIALVAAILCGLHGVPRAMAPGSLEGSIRPTPARTSVQGASLSQEGDANATATTLRIGVARPEGGYSVVSLPLETYVARVLRGEALPDSAPAALEALAIAVRTYTLANRNRHAADGFDLCDETHCQVMRTATPATERAALATAGLALLNGGTPASIYYSASCGGRTEVPSAVWPGMDDPPYLPSQPDDGCGGAPVWSTQLAESDLVRALHAAGFRGGRLRDLRVRSRNSSGRVARLKLEGLEPDEISGPDLRAVVGRTLGWQHIKSTAFELRREADGYRLNGHGSGHGVGMCVIGAARLAGNGEPAVDLLRRYYPGLMIAPTRVAALNAAGPSSRAPRVPSPVLPPAVARSPVPAAAAVATDVSIALPDGDEDDRRAISDLTLRARTELVQTLGVDAPRVALRFHPTVDSYERATTQPWFTSGAVVGTEIHLIPPAVLRSRGILEQVIRRELVRAMTDQALARRPLWVRHGAALYYAGAAGRPDLPADRIPALQLRQTCPDDGELLRPVSPGALNTAYVLAQACFARQIAQGRQWRDVR